MKKALATLLSISMLLSTTSSVFASEFSSGSPDTASLSEEQFTDNSIDADIFASYNERETQEEPEITEPTNNLSAANNSTELIPYTRYDIVPGTGTTTYDEDEEEYTYKFIPPTDGDYSFTFTYDGKTPLEYCSLYQDPSKEDRVYKIEVSENILRFNSLKGGQTYYLDILMEWWGTSRSISLSIEDVTAVLTPEQPCEIPSYLNDETRLRFSPTETGYYYLSFSDTESHYYEVYQKDNEETLSETWLDFIHKNAYLLNAGETYYFSIIPDSLNFHSVTLFKGKTDEEAIRDLFETAKPLPVLPESIETSITFTTSKYDNTQKESLLEFNPSQTRMYHILNQTNPDNGYQQMMLELYDENFNLIISFTPQSVNNLSYNQPVSLNGGSKYYLRAIKDSNDETNPSDIGKLLITSKPYVTSLRIVSGPSRKTLYCGVDVSSEVQGGPHLPGLVLEATYEDGYTETMDVRLYGNKIYSTQYGDVLSCKLDNVDYVWSEPPAGTYSVTISVGEKSVTVNNIIVKEWSKLPTITKQGKGNAVITAAKSGYIRLKTGNASKYKITITSDDAKYPTSFDIYKDTAEHQVTKTTPSGTSLLLGPNSSYIIRTGQVNSQHIYSTVSKVTVTATPSEAMNMSSCTITLPSTATYTGKALTPTVTVKYGSKKLTKGKDFVVTYKNNTKFGTATAIITGKGSYKGKVTKTFKIVPASPSGLKATKSSSALKLQWKKVTGASGYEIYLYKNNKWTKVKTTSALTYTDKTVKKGNTYKYKLRAYCTVNGKKVYSSYTSVKSYKF